MQAPCTHSVPLHKVETLVSMETHLAGASTSGTQRVPTAFEEQQRHFTVAPTAIFSSLIVVGWTPRYPSLYWLGLITRDAPAQYLTTCRTAGACTSGWCLPERCLHGLPVGGDAASRMRFPVAQCTLELGSMLVQLMITGVVLPDCL